MDKQREKLFTRHWRRRFLSIVACVVAITTVYSLTLPAFTLDDSTAEEDPGIVLELAEDTSVEEAAEEAEEEYQELEEPSEPEPIEEESSEEIVEESSSEPEPYEEESPEDEPVDSEEPAEEDSEDPEPSDHTDDDSAQPSESDPEPVPEEDSEDPEPSDHTDDDSTQPSESDLEPVPEEDSEESEEDSSEPEEEQQGDPNADVETSADWNEMFRDIELGDYYSENLLTIARTQLGYEESTKNFITKDKQTYGYTRYGAWYGSPYEDWCAMFVCFCLNYAEIYRSEIPYCASCSRWVATLNDHRMFTYTKSGYIPKPGDIIFFRMNDRDVSADHVGIVEKIDGDYVIVIEGNASNMVKRREYALSDRRIYGYGILPQKMAAQEFSAEVDNEIWVGVSAPEGALPVGTSMVVTRVTDEEVLQTVSDAVDEEPGLNVTGVQAVDITFFDCYGREIEPKIPVTVTMASDMVKESESVVVHLDHEGETEIIESEINEENHKVFEAESFSVYGIVSVDELPEGNITQTFENDKFIITASYSEKAEIPKDAVFKASEITRESDPERYQERMDALRELYQDKAFSCKELLDLGFWVEEKQEGIDNTTVTEVEPADMVLIAIQFKDTEKYSKGDSLSVIHFTEESTEYVGVGALNKDNELGFRVDSFSDFAITDDGTSITYTAPVSDYSNVHKEGDLDTFLSNLPYGTVYIDYDLMRMGSYTWNGNSGVSTVDSDVTCTVELVDGFKLGGSPYGIMYDNLTLASGETVTYDGVVATVRFSNVATISDGSKADVVVTISNTLIKNTALNAMSPDSAIFYGSGLLPAGGMNSGLNRIWGEFDFNIKVVANENTGDLTGKTFLFGMDDYDIPDRNTIATTNALNSTANFVLDIDDEGNLIARKLLRNTNDYIPGYGTAKFTEGNTQGTPTGGEAETIARYFSIPITDEDEKVPLYDVNRSTGELKRVYFTSDPNSEGFVPDVTTTVTEWPAYGLHKTAVYTVKTGEFRFYLLTLEPTVSESATLISGMVSEVYIPDTSYLYIDGYNLYPTRNDEDTLNSGYFLIADANEGLTFTARCQGQANSHLRNSNMFYTIYSRTYEGGSISTVDTDVWGNQTAYGVHQPEVGDPNAHQDGLLVVPKNKTAVYTMTPDTFYHVWKVKISDGTEDNTSGEIDLREVEWDENGYYTHVGENGTSYTFHKDANGVVSYIFEYVDRDHWITVWWEKDPPMQTVTIIKKWYDENNARNSRPDNITVHLVRDDGGRVNPEDEDAAKTELVTGTDANIHGSTDWVKNDAENQWEYTFEVCELPEGATFQVYENKVWDYDRVDVTDTVTVLDFSYLEDAEIIGYNQDNNSTQYRVTLANRRKDGPFSFIKADQFGNLVEGAQFRLYTDADCTKPEPAQFTAQSNANGVVTFYDVPYGMHYMKEMNVPTADDGTEYEDNRNTVYQVYFHEDPDIIEITPGRVENHVFIPDDTIIPVIKIDENQYVVINLLPSGYLVVKKLVTYNFEEPTTDAQKAKLAGTYTFQLYLDEECSEPLQLNGENVEVSITIGDDGQAVSSDPIELPLGDYWLLETGSTNPDMYPSNDNPVKVTITEDHTSEEPLIQEFTNNYDENDGPDKITIDIEKTFVGLDDPSQIPSDFHVILSYTVDGVEVVIELRYHEYDSQYGDHIKWSVSDDGFTWHWHITNIDPEATDFKIKETNYEVTGFTFTGATLDGTAVANPSTDQDMDVTVPEASMSTVTEERITPDNDKTYKVYETDIILISLTRSAGTLVVSPTSLNTKERAAITEAIDNKTGDLQHGSWKTPAHFFSIEGHSEGFYFAGYTITPTWSDEDGCYLVHVEHKQSSMEEVFLVSYDSEESVNNAEWVNNYTETPIDLDIIKVDKNDVSHKLPGAKFTLRQLDEEGYGSYKSDVDPIVSDATDANGETGFTGLAPGYYEIEETTLPAGYVLATDEKIYFKVAGGAVTWLEKDPTKLVTEWEVKTTADMVTFTAAQDDANAAFTIKNTPGVELPYTGGSGTLPYTLSGVLLIMASVLMYGFRLRRKRKGADA